MEANKLVIVFLMCIVVMSTVHNTTAELFKGCYDECVKDCTESICRNKCEIECDCLDNKAKLNSLKPSN
ncbi:hypothetical protein EJD97_019110 [Solanum chilense]|uniref:Uncharacterized protein n=1 Tax=Solanum chilense TaxID=4083 RepID=A0A6N2AZP8_SOLCI|nr:hypothetical protein EJD97_019110 [Solanum chilense]